MYTHKVFLRLDVPLSSPLALRFYELATWMGRDALIPWEQYTMLLNEGPEHKFYLHGVPVDDFEALLELMQEHFGSGDVKTKEWVEALIDEIKENAKVTA